MATREVEHQDQILLKVAELFPKIGMTFTGLYLSDEQNTRFDKQPRDYFFELRSGETGKLTVPNHLRDQLRKLKPEVGDKITIEFVKSRPTTNGNSDQRLFKVSLTTRDEVQASRRPAPVKVEPKNDPAGW